MIEPIGLPRGPLSNDDPRKDFISINIVMERQPWKWITAVETQQKNLAGGGGTFTPGREAVPFEATSVSSASMKRGGHGEREG